MHSWYLKRYPVIASNRPSPLRIPNLIWWLDASDQSAFILDGSNNIDQGSDKSGFNRHAIQGNTNNRPTWLANQLNGHGAIKGNGSNQWLDVASFPSLAGGYTVYAVSRSAGAVNSAMLSINAGVTNSAMIIGNDSGAGSYVSQFGAAVAQPTPTSGVDFARMVKYDGSHTTGNFRIRLSTRVADTTGTMTQAAATPPSGTLSVLKSGTTYSGDNLYEAFIFDRQTTADEDAFLKAYITAKWGIAWS
jgi:hypothetical protein